MKTALPGFINDPATAWTCSQCGQRRYQSDRCGPDDPVCFDCAFDAYTEHWREVVEAVRARVPR